MNDKLLMINVGWCTENGFGFNKPLLDNFFPKNYVPPFFNYIDFIVYLKGGKTGKPILPQQGLTEWTLLEKNVERTEEKSGKRD